MKCLSIKQPWASLIARGIKTVELRTWAPKYRGPLVICAGSTMSRTPNARNAREYFSQDEFPLGVSVCVVDLVDVRAIEAGDAKRSCCATIEDRELAWVLANPRRTPPVPIKGVLSFFPPPESLLSALGI